MSEKSAQFLRRLQSAAPPLQERLHEYVQASEDKSPEGFLLQLALDTTTEYRPERGPAAAWIQATFDFLEREYGAEPEIDELIDGWFLRNLPDPVGSGVVFVELLRPKLRAAKERLHREDLAGTPESTTAFIHRMVEAVPSIEAELREHTDNYTTTVLPNTFLGNVAIEIVDLYQASISIGTGVPPQVRALLDFIEAAFGRDPDVDNLIAVSFIEDMPEPGEPGHRLIDQLPPKLRREYERQQQAMYGPGGDPRRHR